MYDSYYMLLHYLAVIVHLMLLTASILSFYFIWKRRSHSKVVFCFLLPLLIGSKEEDIWYNQCPWGSWADWKEVEEYDSLEVTVANFCVLCLIYRDWLLTRIMPNRGSDISRPKELYDQIGSLKVMLNLKACYCCQYSLFCKL